MPRVLTATVRPLPPFLTPRPPRLTLHHGGRTPGQPGLRSILAELTASLSPPPPVSPPVESSSPAANGTAVPVDDRHQLDDRQQLLDDRQHQMERIAGSLEDVARLLRGRGLSALFRNEPDPLNQRLLSVIADHIGAREPV